MTPFQKALKEIELKMEAIDALRDQIQAWRDDGTFGFEYAELKLNELQSRETDLTREMDELIETQVVTNPPTDAQIEALATAVNNLRNHVVAAAAAEGVVTDVFALVGIALGR